MLHEVNALMFILYCMNTMCIEIIIHHDIHIHYYLAKCLMHPAH